MVMMRVVWAPVGYWSVCRKDGVCNEEVHLFFCLLVRIGMCARCSGIPLCLRFSFSIDISVWCMVLFVYMRHWPHTNTSISCLITSTIERRSASSVKASETPR
jgi:hypothetical protein